MMPGGRDRWWIVPLALALVGAMSSLWVVEDRTSRALVPEILEDGGSHAAGLEEEMDHPEPHTDSVWTLAPFRVDREPPAARYSVSRIDELRAQAQAQDAARSTPPPNASQRPPWTLTGVVVGTPTLAVLEGVSAAEGSTRVVGEGDEVEGLTVVEITQDSVVVHGGDRTWTFPLVRPWN